MWRYIAIRDEQWWHTAAIRHSIFRSQSSKAPPMDALHPFVKKEKQYAGEKVGSAMWQQFCGMCRKKKR